MRLHVESVFSLIGPFGEFVAANLCNDWYNLGRQRVLSAKLPAAERRKKPGKHRCLAALQDRCCSQGLQATSDHGLDRIAPLAYPHGWCARTEMRISPMGSMRATMVSPGLTGLTPSGVPV
jgi:hypothetical protein